MFKYVVSLQGTFAINTDHAAELDRQPDDWMTWTPIFLNLAWLGFEDIHSDIHSYTVNIGSQFMGNDLNEVINNIFLKLLRRMTMLDDDS